MVKIYVQTPLKFWFHIKFSREYDYVNEYPYSAKLQNMTCWTESGTQSSHIKGLDKCVWCWVCSVLSKQRGEVVWWGGGVRFTKANCGQESQWPYTDCGPAVTGMFASCIQNVGLLQQIWLYEIIGGISLMCQNTTMRVYGAWIKTSYVLCPQTYVSFGHVS